MKAHEYVLSGLDTSTAKVLRTELLAHRGQPLTVDASRIQCGGTLGLQVLLSAAKTWEADAISFSVVNPSQTFLESLEILGISHQQLNLSPGHT
jgi:chemotaxis protein CheX